MPDVAPGVKCSNKTDVDALILFLDKVSTEQLNGIMKVYSVSYQLVRRGDIAVEGEPIKLVTFGGNSSNGTLTGLELYGVYKIEISATTVKGKGPVKTIYGGRLCVSLRIRRWASPTPPHPSM